MSRLKIRNKNGEMQDIVVLRGKGQPAVIEELTVTENGTYEVPEGVDGFSPIMVNVTPPPSDADQQLLSLITGTGSITTLPPNITEIRTYCFYGCSALRVSSLPASITKIGPNAFGNCANLTLESLPDGLVELGSGAFTYCQKLNLTTLPEGITSIGSSTFSNCLGFKEMTLHAGIKTIAASAFNRCMYMTTVTFEGTPTTINASAFGQCTGLKTINVPWAEGAVAGAPWGATNATINYNYTGG